MLLQDLPLSKSSEPSFTACPFWRSGDCLDLLGRYRGLSDFRHPCFDGRACPALLSDVVLSRADRHGISYLFITSLPESIGLSVMNLIYHGDVMTQADGSGAAHSDRRL